MAGDQTAFVKTHEPIGGEMNLLPRQYFQKTLPEMRGFLEEIVNLESPSTQKPAVDTLALRIIQELESLDASISIFPQEEAGSNVIGRWGSGMDGILLLIHLDTVYEMGTLAARPLREEGGRLYGPGTLDMKASAAMLLAVMRGFRQHNLWPARPISVLFTSDEETGSHTSRALIEHEARQAGVVFCLEPALANGALKTSRKGTGEIDLRVKGKAAHAGVNHDIGRNAIEELAHHILAVQKLTDYTRGTTVNVGIVSGGTRTNVVPDEANARVDFRVQTMDEYKRLENWVKTRQPVIEGTSLEASIEINRPPMPRDETMMKTFQKAQAIGRALGLELGEGSTGGGSDANFVAPLGVPVMDGLGAIGDGAHSEREYILIDSLAERAQLLAALLLNW
jgi:glutamate carboxypeptidase